MFERFTKDAREVVVLAQEEARWLHDKFIGTEHMLLALMEQGEGPAEQALRDQGVTLSGLRDQITKASRNSLDGDALASIGIDLDQVRQATEASFGAGALDPPAHRASPSGHIPFSKRAKKLLEHALREALRLGHGYIGTGHLLLGILRDAEGRAARLLVETGIDLEELRDETVKLIPPKAA